MLLVAKFSTGYKSLRARLRWVPPRFEPQFDRRPTRRDISGPPDRGETPGQTVQPSPSKTRRTVIPTGADPWSGGTWWVTLPLPGPVGVTQSPRGAPLRVGVAASLVLLLLVSMVLAAVIAGTGSTLPGATGTSHVAVHNGLSSLRTAGAAAPAAGGVGSVIDTLDLVANHLLPGNQQPAVPGDAPDGAVRCRERESLHPG